MRTPRNDELLVARLKAGDQDAVFDLAAAYGPRIYQLAFRHLRNKEDAEEVTQDVLHNVYRKASAFRGDAALSSWIFRITFNAAMSRLRSGKLERQQNGAGDLFDRDGEAVAAPEVLDRSALADEQVFRTELRRRILRAIVALPAIYRGPVMLRDIQGMSTEEASAVLRVKDQTLKSRLHRGRVILRQQLAEFAGGLSLRHALAA